VQHLESDGQKSLFFAASPEKFKLIK